MGKRKREAQLQTLKERVLERRPANATVSHYPPGKSPDRFVPGDFSLHRATTTKGRGGATTMLGKLIQAGERTRFGNTDFARWTHSALIVSETGDIVEAIEKGVARNNIFKYRDTDYMIVHVTASDAQRELACGFADTRVGDKYGIVNFIALAVQALFGWTISFHVDSQFICSGLVSRATEKYITAYPRSPENMMPGDLAYFWDATSGEPLPALGFFGKLLNLLVTFVGLFRGGTGDPAPDPGHPPAGTPGPPPPAITPSEQAREAEPSPEKPVAAAEPGQKST